MGEKGKLHQQKNFLFPTGLKSQNDLVFHNLNF